MAVIRRGKEYENYFDPKAYLTEYHSTVEGSEHEAGFAKFVLDSLHEIFKDGMWINAHANYVNIAVLVNERIYNFKLPGIVLK